MSAHKIWGLSREIHTNAETRLNSSVLEREEASNTSLNPVGLRLIRGQLKVEHEVGRVTRGRQRAVTREHLVERALIDAFCWLNSVLHRQEVDHRHLNEELLRVALSEHLRIIVPLAALQVHTIGVNTRLRLLFNILPAHVRLDEEGEADLIDCNGVLTGKVLLRASEEGLWEEEARNPEDAGGTVVVPILQEGDTVIAVNDPRSKRFHAQEALSFALVSPHLWHLVIED